MCGIIGIIGTQPTAQRLVEGLKRLEYRGYDSAGIAVVMNGQLHRTRAEGKLKNLEHTLQTAPIEGTAGIGHTRWATHGAPNTANAHPHMTDQVCVVHNGIIENFQPLRDELKAKGYRFESDTDTEVIPVLISRYLDEGLSPIEAFRTTLDRLEGAYALGALFAAEPGALYMARHGSPQAIGYGEGEMYMASDAYALAPLTRRITYLEEGDWAVLTSTNARIFDRHHQPAKRKIQDIETSGAVVGKGNFRHFMLKEIHEQPGVIGESLRAYLDPNTREALLPPHTFGPHPISKITIIGCGTSYYAGLTAKYWLEKLCRIPVDVDLASEFRYRDPVLPKDGLVLCISQSGETADTLAALRHAKTQGQHTVGLVNVLESSIARESHAVLRTYAGLEIGVASTKAFTAQLATLACFTLALAAKQNHSSQETLKTLAHHLEEVPSRMAEFLQDQQSRIEGIAHGLAKVQDALFIGRGTAYATALEGALKLKEISYIHAEAYAAGELKHGPIALIDKHMPIIVIAPSDALFEKTASNLQEVAARGGKVILVSDAQGITQLEDYITASIQLPTVDPFVAPLLYALPMQLLAYETAILKGTDVDQPRNLAKSVTVE